MLAAVFIFFNAQALPFSPSSSDAATGLQAQGERIIVDQLKAPKPDPPLSTSYREDERKLLSKLNLARAECAAFALKLNHIPSKAEDEINGEDTRKRERNNLLVGDKKCEPMISALDMLIRFYGRVISTGSAEDKELANRQQQSRVQELVSFMRNFNDAAVKVLKKTRP